MKLSKRSKKVIGYTVIGTVRILQVLAVVAFIVSVAWAVGSLVEVSVHSSAVLNGASHEYSNINLFKLMLEWSGRI